MTRNMHRTMVGCLLTVIITMAGSAVVLALVLAGVLS